MTLVVAWKHCGAAFVVGDSAVTHPGVPASPSSSFGEFQLHDDGSAVEEMTPKVLRLAADVLAGFSGKLRSAESFLNLTWRALARGESLIQVVEHLAPAFIGIADHFQVVFAFVAAGEVRLLHFSSKDGVDHDPGDLCILGSGKRLEHEVRQRITGIKAIGISSDDVIITAILAHLQALGVRDWLPAQYVGGAFFGASLRVETGTTWQPPLTYVLHPPQAFTAGHLTSRGPGSTVALIHTRVHHEAGIIFSSLLGDVLRILPSPWTGKRSGHEWNDALAEIYPGRLALIPDDNTSYFVFLNTGRPRAVVLKRRPRSSFPMRIDNNKLLLTSELVDELDTVISEDEFDCRLIIQPDAELP